MISRVFMNGNSQAVRIPHELRLDSDKVEISRNAQGDLVIRPLPQDRGAALMRALGGFDQEFASVLEEDRREQPSMQDREGF